ncbi:unnamed protein product, partial [Cyprideis torosa]
MNTTKDAIGRAFGLPIAAALLLIATACTQETGNLPGVSGSVRDPSSQIASQIDASLHRLKGRWIVTEATGVQPGTSIVFGAGVVQIGPDTLMVKDLGQGRLQIGGKEVWVHWLDADNRTAALGAPDGKVAWIMDRTGARNERHYAAREILACATSLFGADMRERSQLHLPQSTILEPVKGGTDMRKIAAVIGGGVIGGGWAARFALMGWDVNLYDPDPDAERKMAEVLRGAERALPMLYEVPMPERGTITHCKTISDAVAGAVYIQESVPERLELKHSVLTEIQAACSTQAVIGSSTSGFKPTQLREGASRPGQIVVTHPFNPVYLLPLVELVPGDGAEPAFVETAQRVLREIGMYPLLVRAEIDAHIADRLLEAVWREALWLVKDGVATTEEIDNAIR